jgi:hypothetical protein
MIERIVTEADIANLKARPSTIGSPGPAIDDWFAGLKGIDNPDPEVPPVSTTAPRNLTVGPGDGRIVLTWEAPAGATPTGYRFGRDGADVTTAGPWSGLLPADARTATLDKLVNGRTYTVTLAAVYPSGDVAVTSTVTPVGPANPPTPDPPAGGRRVPLVGKSGLGFNSICFHGGAVSKAAMEQFGRDRGRPMDGVLTFPARGTWAALRTGGVAEMKAIIDAGGLVVYSIPHAPVPVDSAGHYTADAMAINVRGANDAYRAEQRAFGAWLAAVGLDSERFVLRIDWEFNGNWYPWAANNGGPSALKTALRNCITNIRAGGGTRVRHNLCANKSPNHSGSGFAEVFPGADVIDVVGIDQYDMWMPSKNAAQWAGEMARDPSILIVVALAAKHGIHWSLDEGGNTHGVKDGSGKLVSGEDNPAYWDLQLGTVREHAATCAWHNTYLHPGAPASLRHDFAANPASWARYKQLLAK